MVMWRLLYVFLTIALVLGTELRDRRIQRLVGGHLRIINPSSDDAELLEAHSSGSKNKNFKKKSNEANNTGTDDEKKTLAQQVSDGKYGLIQNELFKKPLRQPGIISYDPNPDVPKDNINNLGGLSKEDIWLSENHLLVIKGGTYPKHDDRYDNVPPVWPAIDDYTAPKRPVKLPKNPKVPPPFPVQLTENGPLQILGTNSSRTLDGSSPVYALPPPEGGYVPGTGPFFPQYPDQAYPPARGTQNENSANVPGEGERGSPFPPFINGTSPPSFAHLPPGAVAVPPPLTPSINDFDEDDPSIYYPPPYSFSYPSKDNSSLVPAGPLVPGIILPPPPDFFAPLETPTMKKPTKRPIIITKRPKIQKTTQQSPQIHPTTTPISPTSVINITLRKPIKVIPNNPTDINNELKPIISTTPNTRGSPSSSRTPSKMRLSTLRNQTKRPAVTVLKPVKSIEPHRTYYNHDSPSGKPFAIYGPPITTTPRTRITSTRVPLKHFYSTENEIHSNVVTIVPERNAAKPAQYYYYEEEPQINDITTPRPRKIIQNFFDLPERYFETPKAVNPPRAKYIYVTSKPLNTPKPKYSFVEQERKPDSFSLHLAQLKKQIQYYTSPKPIFREISSPRPVYQYSFQAANYQPKIHNTFRPSQPDTSSNDETGFRPMPKYSVQIQPAIDISSDERVPGNPIYFKQSLRVTTEKPSASQSYYTTAKPTYNSEGSVQKRGRTAHKQNPISQYSFQARPGSQNLRGIYIKPDDSYYDDVNNNKHYSTFGQRIPSQTTAVPNVRYSTRSPKVAYITANSQVQQQKPISLIDDTLVNYVNPRPNINPDAELIPVRTPQRVNYPQVAKYVPRNNDHYDHGAQHYSFNERPQIVNAIPINVSDGDAEKGSFISYSLPGNNGAHFYFLTPQIAQRRDQGAGFYYSQFDNGRIRRDRGSENKR